MKTENLQSVQQNATIN